MRHFHWMILAALLLTSCHKESSLLSISFNVSSVERIQQNDSFDLRKTILSDHCTRISCALFQDGKKVKTITQEVTESAFGQIQLRIPAGAYQVVVIAHSGLQNCTISTPEKITFNGKCTDTFYSYDTLNLVTDTSINFCLRRAVSMFRFNVADSIPQDVATMRFYYTGGSSTFDAVTGYGCVNSRQTEYREVTPEMVGHTATFQIYSFPHQEFDTLSVNVRALSTESDILYESTYNPIPIRLNWITELTTPFFTDSNHNQAINVSLQDSGRWSGTITL